MPPSYLMGASSSLSCQSVQISFVTKPSAAAVVPRRWMRCNPVVVALKSDKNSTGVCKSSRRRLSESGLNAAATGTSNVLTTGGITSRLDKIQKRTKLKVAVDVDEVLGRFLHSLNQFCMDEYGLEYSISDYHIYDFAKVWRCSQDESNHKVHEFFKSDHFSSGIEVIPGSYDSLSRLRDTCQLMVVTSRQHIIQQPTIDWINSHFPNIFDDVHFGNHFALEGKSRKKSEICRSIGARVLIDDNPSYALECASEGIHVLLYDWNHSYPWSKTDDGPSHERITRVRNWEEVEQVLEVLAIHHV